MYNPEYKITEYFVSCCEKIASEIARINEARIELSLQQQLEREFVNRNVHSSTRIEGNRLSFDQVVAVAANKYIAVEEGQRQEVDNCIKAIEWITKNKHNRLTEKRLFNIHNLMTRSLLKESNVGKFRKVQNYIVNSKDQVIFTPPKAFQVPLRIKNLIKWESGIKNVHAFVKSSIFHHELVTIHPFVDGNGRVARAAAQQILFRNGYGPLMTLGLDNFFCKDRDRYYKMIQQVRDLDYDYTYWIDYISEGILYAVKNVSLRLKVVSNKKRSKINITPKQEELMTLLAKSGSIGSSQISKNMKINRARVNQLIAPLVKVKIVLKEGTARATRYRLG